MKHKKKNEATNLPPKHELYKSDAPGVDPNHDRFGRFPFAQRIAQTLGKTTVLTYIDSELKPLHPAVVCVRFNPWRFTDESTLLRSFFETVADGLKRSLATRKERVGKIFKEYGQLVTMSIEYQEAKLSVGEGVKELGEYWSTTSLDEKKLAIEKVLKEEGRRIVVLIDDIDRLERIEIRQLFKLVKLTADFEYISYVLAFDPEIVAGALGETYGAGAAKDGRSFLEKIVQVPLTLPAADPAELQEYCFDHVNEALRTAQTQLPVELRQEFEMEFDRYFAPVLGTPRAAKRYANALAFIMPLLAGEVNPLDVMLLEALKIFYPSIHAAIRESPEGFTGNVRMRGEGGREKAKLKMQQLLSDGDIAEFIIKLFPLVRGILRDGKFDVSAGEEVEWSQQQRVASSEYLRRYLACAVPRGDISDRTIDELIVQLKSMTIQHGSDRFAQFIGQVNPTRLLWKLRVRVKQMDEGLARHIAFVIASSGDGIPGPTDKGLLGSPSSSAALLIRILLSQIEEPSARFAAAMDVLAIAKPLPFAHYCFQSMRSEREGLDASADDLSKLEAVLADRIATFAQGASLLKSFPNGIDWLILLFQWQRIRGSEPVYDYYRRVLAADARESVAIVKFQLGLYVGGLFTNDFQVAHYKNLALLADPADVYRALEDVNISKLTSEVAKVIGQFKSLYEKQQETPLAPDAG